MTESLEDFRDPGHSNIGNTCPACYVLKKAWKLLTLKCAKKKKK